MSCFTKWMLATTSMEQHLETAAESKTKKENTRKKQQKRKKQARSRHRVLEA